jgi:glycosyltransferase involved in cell wall biosynthesis
MRILWVKAGKLLPVDTGGKIRSFNILKYLARWNQTTLLSYYAGPCDDRYEDELVRCFPGAIAVPARLPQKTSVKGLSSYVGGLFSPLPYAVYKHTSAEVRSRISSLLASGSFDVAVCDFLAPAANFDLSSGVPIVMFEHNVEAILWQRQAANQRNPITRLLYQLEAAKMLRYESDVICSFDHIVAVSDTDASWFRRRIGPSGVGIVPTGVDTRCYTRPQHGTPDNHLIVFVGSMDWEPNVDAVLHFCNAILPSVRELIPEVRFRIVGRNPGTAVRRLASASIEITGSVDSVIPHLLEAAVVVVPLRAGGGTRLKILEAMAMGKAVVSTTIGAEGLDLKDGSEIILADQPTSFAHAVVGLLRSKKDRRFIEENAAAVAHKRDWENAAAMFHDMLVRVVSGPARPCSLEEPRSGKRVVSPRFEVAARGPRNAR